MPSVPRKRVVVVELTGAPQQLSSGLARGLLLRMWSMQPGEGNTGPVYVGADADTVSATTYGTRLPASTDGVPCPPYMEEGFADGTVAVEDVWVQGTSGELLHLNLTVHGGQRAE